MKKVAIGCLVVFVVVGAAVVGIGYYGYLKVRSTVAQLAELQKVPEIERGIRVKTPFVVPASGELTASQVDRFMKVTTSVRDRLGKDMAAFERTTRRSRKRSRRRPPICPRCCRLIATWRPGGSTRSAHRSTP